MPKDTIALALAGDDIHLEAFSTAVSELYELLKGLSQEIHKGVPITWIVQDLSRSSALAVVRGESVDRPEVVEAVVFGYGTVGHALEMGNPVPYSNRVVKHARAIEGLLTNGWDIESIRFETPDRDAIVRPKPKPGVEQLKLVSAYGAVEGRLQTLSNRHGVRFTLYDQLRDKAVFCYLRQDDSELAERLRTLWGKRVIVEGHVTRDPVFARPLTIREISDIVPLAEQADFLNARGALGFSTGDELPEDMIRRLRDG